MLVRIQPIVKLGCMLLMWAGGQCAAAQSSRGPAFPQVYKQDYLQLDSILGTKQYAVFDYLVTVLPEGPAIADSAALLEYYLTLAKRYTVDGDNITALRNLFQAERLAAEYSDKESKLSFYNFMSRFLMIENLPGLAGPYFGRAIELEQSVHPPPPFLHHLMSRFTHNYTHLDEPDEALKR